MTDSDEKLPADNIDGLVEYWRAEIEFEGLSDGRIRGAIVAGMELQKRRNHEGLAAARASGYAGGLLAGRREGQSETAQLGQWRLEDVAQAKAEGAREEVEKNRPLLQRVLFCLDYLTSPDGHTSKEWCACHRCRLISDLRALGVEPKSRRGEDGP